MSPLRAVLADAVSRGAAPPEQPAPETLTGPVVLEELLASLDDLPAQRPVAARMVQLTHDEDVSAAQLASVAAADASVTARLMRLANSAYYGLSGRVRTLGFAVTVVGFTTVRTIALSAAAGFDSERAVPDGFWERSASAAVAAGELARRFGLQGPDAFCLGLLSGIGQALLHRADEREYTRLAGEAVGRHALAAAERSRYGVSHVSVSASALRAWSFPPDMATALQTLDSWPLGQPADGVDATTRCLLVAREVADRVTGWGSSGLDARHMSGGRVDEDDLAALARRVPPLAAELVRAVQS
ncbi:HDOD domain-containing protein [Aquipuribacter sp. SD81]|uniref:HDOD domain-containing protein n=1 Tax=Aquipuribacter sp. SD81 TaxID=3127703 RepID=UPI003018CE13